MRGEGADGLVVAMKPANAAGAKRPDDPAKETGQPAMGGGGGWGKALYPRLDHTSRMRRESHVRFC